MKHICAQYTASVNLVVFDMLKQKRLLLSSHNSIDFHHIFCWWSSLVCPLAVSYL
jgi:hypothetical protein